MLCRSTVQKTEIFYVIMRRVSKEKDITSSHISLALLLAASVSNTMLIAAHLTASGVINEKVFLILTYRTFNHF